MIFSTRKIYYYIPALLVILPFLFFVYSDIIPTRYLYGYKSFKRFNPVYGNTISVTCDDLLIGYENIIIHPVKNYSIDKNSFRSGKDDIFILYME